MVILVNETVNVVTSVDPFKDGVSRDDVVLTLDLDEGGSVEIDSEAILITIFY